MIAIVMQVILAVFILVGGFIKLLRISFQVEHWQHYQYPLWFMSVIGFIELIGAIGMIGGIWNRYLAVGSGVLFVLIMIGALHAHIFRAHQSIVMIIPAMICLILSIIVIIKNLTFT
ncbi:DoxX family protein [Peribacillus frigoritolerans]|uniref:DoxX family protein n=1 Tax=Peribacillus frigoritolerans TaxID=450367 RepID=UPI002227F2A7|nr:DoxX family protein [Peribacillus frigoritolerans]UYY99351.1 DoxX family protein [Peribacillus frigoritolerans]WHY14486.1 DoxX family protein [Peribacillus frigoritolerans]